jgi:hypothetical protein
MLILKVNREHISVHFRRFKLLHFASAHFAGVIVRRLVSAEYKQTERSVGRKGRELPPHSKRRCLLTRPIEED